MAVFETRVAQPSDIPQMVSVLSSSFMNDDVFGRFMHPHRLEFPDDWHAQHEKWIRSSMVEASTRCFVRADNQNVVAFCFYKRMGGGGAKLRSLETYPDMLQRWRVQAYSKWIDWTWTDRSADTEAIRKFAKNWADIKHLFEGDRKECWMMSTLCVSPEAQKQGHGKALVDEAIKLANNEVPKVMVAVISSKAGDEFYQRLGFYEVGRANVGDLSHLDGGSVKFYDRHLKE